MAGALLFRRRRIRSRLADEVMRSLLAVVAALLVGSLVGLSRTGASPLVRADASVEAQTPPRDLLTAVAIRVRPSDPAEVASVQFELRPASGRAIEDVRILLEGEGGRWHTCRAVGSTVWVCETPGLALTSTEGFRVLAR